MKIKDKNILITGGAGFIGSHIVDLLIKERPRQIIIFDNFIRGTRDNLKKALKNKKVKIIKGDVTNFKQINQAMKNIDYVFHEVALWLLHCEENPREAIRVNIEGTLNVLEACVKNKVKKIIVASSASVYGDAEIFPTEETHPFNNYLFYGTSKVADEQLLRVFWKKYGLDFIALRYFNVYGDRQEYNLAYTSVIMKFIDTLEKGNRPTIYGDGSATMDLIFVEDIAEANILALKSDVTNEVLNVATGKETSLKELLEIIMNLLGIKDVKPIYKPYNKQLVVRRCGSTKKARKLIGFKSRTSVKLGVQRVIQWRAEQEKIKTQKSKNRENSDY